MSAHKRPESVLVVVYSEDAQVLLLRRHEPATFWQSVAGSLEWDEQPQDAAVREVAEETGLADVRPVDCAQSHEFEIYPFWRHRYAEGVHANLEHVFRLQLPRPCAVRLDPREHAESVWLPRSAALRKATSPTNRQAIRDWVPTG